MSKLQEVAFEKAGKEDAELLAGMILSEFSYTNANPENVEERIGKKGFFIYKAVKGGKTIGFFEIQLVDSKKKLWRLNGIAINRKERGKGFGEKALEKAIDSAREKGAERMSLFVREDNAPAKRLYEKKGFAEKRTLKKPVGGKKAVEMELEI